MAERGASVKVPRSWSAVGAQCERSGAGVSECPARRGLSRIRPAPLSRWRRPFVGAGLRPEGAHTGDPQQPLLCKGQRVDEWFFDVKCFKRLEGGKALYKNMTIYHVTIMTSCVQMRQSKQSAPFWRVSLSTLCRLVTSVDDEGWSQERADQEVEQEEAELSEPGPAPLSEELYGLRLLCRMLQNREQRLQSDSVEFVEESPDVPLKRKSPYILKRQTHNSKSRRPYILKRSPVY
ncbi:neurotensin/neuromedin N [Boleophthalmus pectinirostris]|uniref:neurotensin/neuromedin N n=1 Tax=Boleophthalmus pectinirostris TaxID=150288 RepID=UPI00242FF6A6|nr:neurotensin/neuromedin N [Boleophthalmus pectinirostris]